MNDMANDITLSAETSELFFDLAKVHADNINHMKACGSWPEQSLREFDSKFVSGLFSQPVADVVQIAGDNDIPLCKRTAAGLVLAIRGDPRIDPFAPEMISVPNVIARIGRNEAELETDIEQLSGLGLELDWLLKEAPCFEVELHGYRIAKFPVTNCEYRQFLLDNPSALPPSRWVNGVYPVTEGNHPVHSVSLNSARKYAAWLSLKTSRDFRLPTEYEWEFAATGPTRLQYPWGNQYRAGNANTLEEGLLGTTPVGVWPGGRSPLGCEDMAGNVMEWIDGGYHVYPQGRRIDDWYVQQDSGHPIARGGGYDGSRDLARSQRRLGITSWASVGFRLAETCRTANQPT
jgi:toxoflavin biosynthesis protein ToxD